MAYLANVLMEILNREMERIIEKAIFKKYWQATPFILRQQNLNKVCILECERASLKDLELESQTKKLFYYLQ